MHVTSLSDEELFRGIDESGARVLLIGRRALILLGAPVMTSDYDFWVHIDDIDKLNGACEKLEHAASCSASAARARGRYVIENGERLDVLVARSQASKLGTRLAFDDAWSRRQEIKLGHTRVFIPAIADLIITKQWSLRAKDIADIQWLELLRDES